MSIPRKDEQINIIEQMKKYYKEQRGVLKASDASYEWFDATLGRKKDNSVEKWKRPTLDAGKMYRFIYDPVHKDTLPFYDKNPVIISLGQRTYTNVTVDVGLNINFLPRLVREYFIHTIHMAHRDSITKYCTRHPNDAHLQGLLNISYKQLLTALESYGMGYAIRSYYPNHMRKIGVISYENWYRGVAMRPKKDQFVNTGIIRISKRYRAALNI